MEDVTVLDISLRLGITSDAVRKRLNRLGIQPLKYIGSAAIYPNNVIEIIKVHGVRGRPKAKAQEEPIPETKVKPKKTTKKT